MSYQYKTFKEQTSPRKINKKKSIKNGGFSFQYLFFFLAFIYCGASNATGFLWANNIGESSSGGSSCRDIAIDASGNRYVTGSFSGFEVDFDPGPGTSLLSGASGFSDIFVAKYDSSGNFIWAFGVGGTGSGNHPESGYGIAVSGSDVYVIGQIGSIGVIDMDPSSASQTITGAGDNDVFVAKYDGSLNPSSTSFCKWAFSFGGTGSDVGFGIAVSGSDVYVAGRIHHSSPIDMNPSGNSNTISGGGGYDAFVAKYDGSLTPSNTSFYKWAFKLGSTNSVTDDIAFDIAVSGTDIYVTGNTAGSNTDFDPSSNSNMIPATGSTTDNFVVKYDGSLTPSSTSFYKWAFRLLDFNGYNSVYGTKIAVSGSDIYLTGVHTGGDADPSSNSNVLTTSGYNGFVARYDGSLTPSNTSFYKWGFSFGGPANDDVGYGIAVSGSDVYVTGTINGTTAVDMDPSTNSNMVTGAGVRDAFVAKYDGSLTPSNTSFYKWAFPLGGIREEYGYGIAASANNIAVGGVLSSVNVDFDPSGATADLSSYSSSVFIAGYSAAGTYRHAFTIGNLGGDDAGQNVATDTAGNTYAIGYFTGQVDFDPGTGTYYLATQDVERDIYVVKYNSSGGLVWAFNLGGITTAGGGNDDNGYSIFVSGTDVYITGNIYDTLAIDMDPSSNTNTIKGAGSSDIFLAKYDGSLTPSSTSFYQWAFAVGGTGADIGYNVAVSGMDIYVTGKINGTSNIDMDPSTATNIITGAGGDDIFIAKYDASLNPSNTSFCQWVFPLGGPGADIGHNIAISGSDIYVSGKINGTAAIDMDPSSNTNNLTGAGGDDVFVAKYDGSLLPSSTSFYQWAFNAGGTGNDVCFDMALSGSDVYITGQIFGTAAIDMDPSADTNNVTPSGLFDAFVAKYNGSLTPSSVSFCYWAFALGNAANREMSNGIAVSGNDVYITGQFSGAAVLDMDPSANINSLTGLGAGVNYDIFVARYDGSLNPTNNSFYKWAIRIGDTGSDIGRGICIDDNNDEVCITGSYSGLNVDFDPSPFSNTYLSAIGSGNAFVGRYSALDPVSVEQLSFPVNNNFTIFPNPGNGVFTINIEVPAKDNYMLSVVNTLGQLVHQETFVTYQEQMTQTLDLSNFERGIYFVSVSNDKQRITEKVIIK